MCVCVSANIPRVSAYGFEKIDDMMKQSSGGAVWALGGFCSRGAQASELKKTSLGDPFCHPCSCWSVKGSSQSNRKEKEVLH